jgi:hypothetical protein
MITASEAAVINHICEAAAKIAGVPIWACMWPRLTHGTKIPANTPPGAVWHTLCSSSCSARTHLKVDDLETLVAPARQ